MGEFDHSVRGAAGKRRTAEYVYFVLSPGEEAIKIGVAVNPFDRIDKLQQGNPCELELFGCVCGHPRPRVLEADLHARFAHLRIRGEWFESAGDLLDYIDAHCNQDDDEAFCALRDARYPDAEEPPADLKRPTIPRDVPVPSGKGRKARMERYLLARGLAA